MTPVSLKSFSIKLGDRVLLDSCDLDIDSGKSTVIIGPTGTGKSVFLKTVAGIIPTRTFSFNGTMRVLDHDAYVDGRKGGHDDWSSIMRSGLVFVPAESAQAMNPALTLEQNLKLLAPEERTIIETRLKKYFNIDFGAFARLYPDEVSGGELQRVTLMILLSRPGCLVMLDEPTVNLDRNLRKRFVEFLNAEILSDKAKTILMASHDLDFIQALNLDQAYGLEQAKIVRLQEIPRSGGYEKPPAKQGNGPALELSDVSQTFFKRGIFGERTFSAFNALSIKYERSTIYGITGPSGCGKSSMIKAILRLMDGTKGSITLDGADLVSMKPGESGSDPVAFKPFRRKMAVVQQDSRFSFFPDLRIRDSFAQIFRNRGVEETVAMESLRANLDKVGLTEAHLDAYPRSLSSGEMKRMDIAMTLTAKPDVLFLDEPFAHIDFETRTKVMRTISDYMAANATILIVVTHEDFDLRYFVEKSFDFPELTGQTERTATA
jgi:peptide/nickel transport system ATP-binding protein